MKHIIYISIAFLLFSCATTRDEQYLPYSNYKDKTYNIMELIPEFNHGQVELTSVKKILIDTLAFSIYWKDKALKALSQCTNVESVGIDYPSQYKEEGLSAEINSILTDLPHLQVVGVGFDSLSVLPNYVNGNPRIREIYYFGRYVERVDRDLLVSDSLKYVQLNFRTTSLDCDFTKCENIMMLTLFVNGKIEAPRLDSLDQLRFLSFHNDEIEEFPDDFFGVENLLTLDLHLPKLKKLNPNLNRLKQLEGLAITSYELNHLPEFVGEMSSLLYISLTTAGRIKSLTPLRKLPNLQSLTIYGIDPILVIDDIVSMPSLKYLYLSVALLHGQDLSALEKLKETEIKQVKFINICTIEENGEFVGYELEEQISDELYNKLHELLPRKYFRH